MMYNLKDLPEIDHSACGEPFGGEPLRAEPFSRVGLFFFCQPSLTPNLEPLNPEPVTGYEKR